MKNPEVVAKPLFETWSLGGLEFRSHTGDACAGRPCTLHNPSAHSMVTWQLNWRGDRGMMERICPTHRVGHPDPDDARYRAEALGDTDTIHSCCGCCAEPPTE